MAQFTRTKKLTSYVYSPTDPASEDAIRLQVDNSIQEVADIFYSQDVGKGASQVGINGLAYATVQDLAKVVSDSGTGTAPPALSVGTAQIVDLAVTVGKLSASLQSILDKIDQAATPLTDGYMTSAQATKVDGIRKFVSLSDLNKVDATLTDVPDCSVSVEAGKTYRIETFAKYQTTIVTTGIKFYSYLPSGAGTILGEQTVFLDSVGTTANALQLSVVAIGASGLTGSGQTTVGVNPINTDLIITQTVVFKCTSTGEFRHQFASEVAAASVLKAGVTVLVSEV